MNNKWLLTIIWMLIIVCVGMVFCFIYVFGGNGLSVKLEQWGYFGSFTAGVFSLLSIAILSYTLLNTQNNHNEQIKILSREQLLKDFMFCLDAVAFNAEKRKIFFDKKTRLTIREASRKIHRECYEQIKEKISKETSKKTIISIYELKILAYQTIGNYLIRNSIKGPTSSFYAGYPLLLDYIASADDNLKKIFLSQIIIKLNSDERILLLSLASCLNKDKLEVFKNHPGQLILWGSYIELIYETAGETSSWEHYIDQLKTAPKVPPENSNNQ